MGGNFPGGNFPGEIFLEPFTRKYYNIKRKYYDIRQVSPIFSKESNKGPNDVPYVKTFFLYEKCM